MGPSRMRTGERRLPLYGISRHDSRVGDRRPNERAFMDAAPTDEQRFPLLNPTGRRMLRRLREHPHRPRYNFQTGDRLTEDALARVRAYAARLRTDRVGWRPGGLPPWVPPFVAFCRREVPFYRRQLDWPDEFAGLPTTNREDLRREPWAFVPDSADLTGLIVYTTT